MDKFSSEDLREAAQRIKDLGCTEEVCTLLMNQASEVEALLLDTDPHNERAVSLALQARNTAKEFAYAIAMRLE